MGARRPPVRHRRRRVINGDAAVRGRTRARGWRSQDTRAPPCARAGRGDRRSASARGPPASPHGPASENLGSGPIARILPWPHARGRTGSRQPTAYGPGGARAGAAGAVGRLPRGGDGGEQQPGSHQALLPLSQVCSRPAARPVAPAQLRVGTGSFPIPGAVLSAAGCMARSQPLPARCTGTPLPKHGNQKYPQTVPNVPWV